MADKLDNNQDPECKNGTDLVLNTDLWTAIDPKALQYTPQGSAIDPEALQYTPQGSAIDPEALQYTPQGSAIDPQALQYTPQGSAIDPQALQPQPDAKPKSEAAHSASGSEGELVIRDDGTALKRYKPGFKCNAKILEKVKAMSGKGYVADVIDYGTMDFDGTLCDFELMKYYPLGAAAKYDLRGNVKAITRIVAKIALCLDACHKNGFIHKDVKPANILITNKDTWECVLCDFGFADALENGKVSTIQNRTPIYAAPEVYDPSNVAVIGGKTYCTLTPASDFYSLGMTALSLWKGEKSLYAREAELAIEKRNDKIKVDKDIPDPLNRIIRGLLVRDPAHRWGFDEIRRTVQEKEDVPVYAGGFEVIFNGQKNQVANSPEELAAFMLKDQKLAKSYLYSGQVSKWLEKRPEMKIEIDRIVEKDFPKDETSGMLCALHILNPLYDLNLRTPDNPGYAMTGEAIGAVLNEAYNIFYSVSVNACTLVDTAPDRPVIIRINSALIELMTEDELRFVVGHELGHQINRDGDLSNLISFIFPELESMSPLLLQLKVRAWNQLCELVADRFGFLAAGNRNACISAFFKLQSGLNLNGMNIDIDAFVRHNHKLLAHFYDGQFLSLCYDDHPANAIRVEAINAFAQRIREEFRPSFSSIC